MKRLGSILLLIFLQMSSAQAGTVEDRIVSQLKGYGYTEIEVSRTLLGRSRIVAQNSGALREIVVNPYTGEILRDITTGNEFDGLINGPSVAQPTDHPAGTGTALDGDESSSDSSDGGGDGDGSD